MYMEKNCIGQKSKGCSFVIVKPVYSIKHAKNALNKDKQIHTAKTSTDFLSHAVQATHMLYLDSKATCYDCKTVFWCITNCCS